MYSPKALLIIILLALMPAVACSKSGLKVLSCSGDIDFREKTHSTWKTLKTGENLDNQDVIRVGTGSKVNLLREDGRYVSISTPGEYDVEDIIGKMNGKSNGFTGRFLSSVYHTLSSNTDYFRDNKYNKGNALSGIVLRNYQGFFPIRYPVSSYFISNKVTFAWYRKDTVGAYTFRIKDMFDKEVYSQVVQDTAIELNLKTIGLAEGSFYFWQIANSCGKSDEYYICRLPEDRSESIRDTIARIGDEFMGKDNQTLEYLAKARYFEDNDLLYDAYIAYRLLADSNPNDMDMKKHFVLFLLRHNLMQEAHANLE